MNKEEIKKLALECGFHLKVQDDGSKDLNPYVYQFAGKLCERTAQAGRDAHQALLAMVSEDLRKVLEKLNAHETKAAIEDLEGMCARLGRCEKALHCPRVAIEIVIEEDERAAIFALMDAIGEVFKK